MSEHAQRATAWIYSGLWSALVAWFRVPKEPPTLPVPPGGSIQTFRPAPGFLRYMKFKFWIGLLAIDITILIVWLVILVAVPLAGIVLAPVAFVVAVVPDVVVYIAIHLRYDTTWYVMSDRSLRIRRGIWVIREVTLTFENVQNVKVRQGPVQRYFGIADLTLETAGAGSQVSESGAHTANQGLVEGVGNADQLRDIIMSRLRHSKTAGLGDDADERAASLLSWSARHVDALREIRDEVAALGR